MYVRILVFGIGGGADWAWAVRFFSSFFLFFEGMVFWCQVFIFFRACCFWEFFSIPSVLDSVSYLVPLFLLLLPPPFSLAPSLPPHSMENTSDRSPRHHRAAAPGAYPGSLSVPY